MLEVGSPGDFLNFTVQALESDGYGWCVSFSHFLLYFTFPHISNFM